MRLSECTGRGGVQSAWAQSRAQLSLTCCDMAQAFRRILRVELAPLLSGLVLRSGNRQTSTSTMATSNTNYQGSSGYTDPALVQPGIVSGSSGVQGGGHGTTGATGVHGTGTGTAGAASSLAPTTTAVGTTTTTSGYGSGSSGAYRGKKVPFAGGAEPRGVDSVGKKLGLAAFSLFLPPAAVAARTGDVCETGLNMVSPLLS